MLDVNEFFEGIEGKIYVVAVGSTSKSCAVME